MKHTLYIITLFSIVLLSSCSTKQQTIAESYEKEISLPELSSVIHPIGGKIRNFTIRNFNNNPTDTIFEWEVYEGDFTTLALENLEYSREQLIRAKNINAPGAYEFAFDNYLADSIALEDILQLTEELKHDSSILALGYEYDEHYEVEYDNITVTTTNHKMIYIMPNDDVYSCISF